MFNVYVSAIVMISCGKNCLRNNVNTYNDYFNGTALFDFVVDIVDLQIQKMFDAKITSDFFSFV